MDIFKCALQHFVGHFCQTALWRSSQSCSKYNSQVPPEQKKLCQTTTPGTPIPTLYEWCVGSLTSNSYLIKSCETGPPAYSPYPRRLKSLTICCCNSGNTFHSVILRTWVLVQLESNSRPPPSQLNAQPTDLPRWPIEQWGTRPIPQCFFPYILYYSYIFFFIDICFNPTCSFVPSLRTESPKDYPFFVVAVVQSLMSFRIRNDDGDSN